VDRAKKIIKSNVNVNEQDSHGVTPLIWVASHGNLKGVKAKALEKTVAHSNNLKIAKLLLESHAYIDDPGKTGSTPLIWASEFGSP